MCVFVCCDHPPTFGVPTSPPVCLQPSRLYIYICYRLICDCSTLVVLLVLGLVPYFNYVLCSGTNLNSKQDILP